MKCLIERFVCCGLQEYQKGKHDLLVDGVEMNNVVYMFKCEDSTLTVKGKLNSVVLDSCRKASVVVDSVVASIEFINCQSVQMQVNTPPNTSLPESMPVEYSACNVYNN
ncbi:hypothetical protein PR048_027016 [Dryococelus australis]|uniref:C-CAP/cofactor C-like domain-containing protein n=1 Tax=Dryococelus australis TaxID=614101 RepID=A0ABQ9GN00_9NEOP|nr:hypothetical protein PR048_027016 [Dryococelus australis]